MRSTEIQALLKEARDITNALGMAKSNDERVDLLRRADQLENDVAQQKRATDRKTLDAQLQALGVASGDAGSPQNKVAPFAERFNKAFDRGRLALKGVDTTSGGGDLSLPTAAPTRRTT